ncbi:hypothetical protein V1517DRAFT_308784 [Lipomyces orientalis]|uniref:Uncharacterized protein n=1 Tax=Lipomyces orientalis TaxID=1233043 RepID=A0ACC3TK25_9ASCO
MSHVFRVIVSGWNTPKSSRIAPIMMVVAGYKKRCTTYDVYVDGDVQQVTEASCLVVYQDGVDLTKKEMAPNYSLIKDLVGSAKVLTLFKVGGRFCTLHGQWNSQPIPPVAPDVSHVTCPGTDRVWTLASSDPNYYTIFGIGSTLPIPQDYYMNSYSLCGKYCESY